MCVLAGPIMEVVEMEDLEDEDFLKSTSTLSRQDLMDFFEETGEEELSPVVRKGEGLGPGEMKVEGIMNVAIALEVEGHDGGEVMVGGEVELEADEEGGVKLAVSVDVMGGKKGVVKAVEVLGQGVIEVGSREGVAMETPKKEENVEEGGGQEEGGEGTEEKEEEVSKEEEVKAKEEKAEKVEEEAEKVEEREKVLKKSEELETVIEEDEVDLALEGKLSTGLKGKDVDRTARSKPTVTASDSSSTESTWKSSTMSEEPTQLTKTPSKQTPEPSRSPSAEREVSAPKPSSSHGTSLLERRLVTGKSRDESLQRMREVCGMREHPVLPSGPGAIWDHEKLNKAQFVQLVELFIGRDPPQELVESIADYIKSNYTEYDKVSQQHV